MSSSKKAKDKETKNAPTVLNRKANHDYQILKKFEAGVVLQGSEVKSCRDGKVQLVDSYAAFERGELFLHKAHIAEFKQSGPHFNHVTTRKRKLLMHASELKKLEMEIKTSGLTLIPLKFYFVKGNVKVEIGLAKGKKAFDKRETIKKGDEKRQMDRALKSRR